MHTLHIIDYAIASVLERGEQLSIPNVFSAYFQYFSVSVDVPDGVSPDDTSAIARAALVSFERAMDKYPMPSRPVKQTNTKTKASKPKTQIPKPPSDPLEEHASHFRENVDAGRVMVKMFSAEVEQLRWDYQQQLLRAAAGDEENGCTCLSCGSLVSLREQTALLATQYKNLERQLVQLEEMVTEMPTKRRIRKTKKTKAAGKKTQHAQAIPFDPYAPSTSSSVAPI
ncbi:hypothetical protein C8Q80DRAFT_1275068 [Daedaleopsis nitida]|nr:hypothetical protein C8Q80DRAFT_1275068 [Daedaleopsis nitida]